MNMRIFLAALVLAASATSVLPTGSAADMCTAAEESCPGTFCFSSSPYPSDPRNCNIAYVPRIDPRFEILS